MRTDDFDYELPDELIAQAPAEPRDSCRLLVLHRGEPVQTMGESVPLAHGGSVEHRHFFDIIDFIEPGDLLVINQTRVMPARLIGRKPTGGMAETATILTRLQGNPDHVQAEHPRLAGSREPSSSTVRAGRMRPRTRPSC